MWRYPKLGSWYSILDQMRDRNRCSTGLRSGGDAERFGLPSGQLSLRSWLTDKIILRLRDGSCRASSAASMLQLRHTSCQSSSVAILHALHRSRRWSAVMAVSVALRHWLAWRTTVAEGRQRYAAALLSTLGQLLRVGSVHVVLVGLVALHGDVHRPDLVL